MEINAKTKLICLIGNPVEHSFSPNMHNAAFDQLGLNFCYLALKVEKEDIGDALKGVKAMNFRGMNVTIPHKEAVIPLLDEVEEEAEFIGAVNTVKRVDDRLVGYNTDGRGFMESLKESGINPGGMNVFILGAGGASRAVSCHLAKVASKLFIFDTDQKKGLMLVRDLKRVNDNVMLTEDKKNIKSADIVINATPLGLREDDPLPVEPDLLTKRKVVCDLIYWETPLLKTARERGCTVMNGLGMLHWQGVLAFTIWTGVNPPVDLMRDTLMRQVEKKRADSN